MKFHDIAEPAIQEPAIGIDLGTTNSLIAIKTNDQRPVIIKGEDGQNMLPSVVLYSDNEVIVGQKAIGHDGAISSIKRLMGKGIEDLKLSDIAIKIHSSSNQNNIVIDINGKAVSPVEVSAEILKKLKQRAENKLQQIINKVVLTVPAYFDDASRHATRMAARLAGLEVVRLINEPTAAAIAYGLDKKENGTFLIYDLGGGTFDISIMKKQAGILQVIATAGDINLGGDNFDLSLIKLIKDKYQFDFSLTQQILVHIKKIREYLTYNSSWSGNFLNSVIEISRKDFERSINDLLKQTIKLITRALRDAELEREEIAEVVLVGGATRTPAVIEVISDFFGRKPLNVINPDEIVALGAAVQAQSLLYYNQDSDSNLLLDVTPLTLSIELMGGVLEPIITRNTPIPISITKTFTNYSAEQTGIKLNIFQGEGETKEDCRSLAQLELKNIPRMQAGEAKIEITFIINADGILTVIACEKTTNIQQEITLNPSYGLTEEVVLALLRGNK